MRLSIAALVTVMVLTSGVAFAEDSDSSGKAYFLCKSGASVRSIRIQKKNGICQTYYTKEGVDSVMSHSSKPQICIDVATKIRNNLESGDWKCRDISESRVSSSAD